MFFASRNNNTYIWPNAHEEFKVLFEVEEYLHVAEQESRILRKKNPKHVLVNLCVTTKELFFCGSYQHHSGKVLASTGSKGSFLIIWFLKPTNEHFCLLFALRVSLMHSLDIFWPWKILRGCRKGEQILPLV